MKSWMIWTTTALGITCGAATVAAASNTPDESAAVAFGKDAGVVPLMAKDAGASLAFSKDGGGWITMAKDAGVSMTTAKESAQVGTQKTE
jgi:hypothetical protein